jgi:hypothetical protein
MQKLSLKWGLIAGLIMVGIPYTSYLLMGGGPETFKLGEIIGYATIICSLLLIYVAINEYRLILANQQISFIQGLSVGLMVTGLAALMFGIYNVIYVEFLEPGFMDQYYNYYIEQISNSGQPQLEIDRQIKAFEEEKQMFMNIYLQFFIMFITVFVIGLLVSVFCAALQSRMVTNTKEQPTIEEL